MKTTVRLKRSFPMMPDFLEAAAGLSLEEVAHLTRLILAWWQTGELPRRPVDCGRALHVQDGHAAAMVARLAPRFAPGTYLATLRAAHVVKATRRAQAGQKGMAVRWGRKKRDVSQLH